MDYAMRQAGRRAVGEMVSLDGRKGRGGNALSVRRWRGVQRPKRWQTGYAVALLRCRRWSVDDDGDISEMEGGWCRLVAVWRDTLKLK
jgi:hypothetical protein